MDAKKILVLAIALIAIGLATFPGDRDAQANAEITLCAAIAGDVGEYDTSVPDANQVAETQATANATCAKCGRARSQSKASGGNSYTGEGGGSILIRRQKRFQRVATASGGGGIVWGIRQNRAQRVASRRGW